MRNGKHVSTRHSGFCATPHQAYVDAVDWDHSVSRTTLVLSEGNLIDDAGLGRPAIDVASALAQLIEIMKGDL